GFGGISMIEMNGIGILSQKREPDVIGRNDSTAKRMLVNITHFEIFIYASCPALLDGHSLVLVFPKLFKRFLHSARLRWLPHRIQAPAKLPEYAVPWPGLRPALARRPAWC